jgi:hypothetical protein
MYYERLPTYVYPLPCGHDIHSLTRSEPDDLDGRHWFICRQCNRYAGLTPAQLDERPPRHPAGMRMSDRQLAIRTDSAIARDRVAAYYAAVWSAVSVLDVASVLGVSVRHTQAVALDLGVYEPVGS